MSPRTKRLILCCDGSFTPQPASHSRSFAHAAHTASNVARFSRMLARHGADDVPQIVFYLSGLASTLEQDGTAAYLFLAANYAAGDEIAVFGGGRGASAARLVAGLVTEVGLLKPGEVGRWGRLSELYTERVGWGRGEGAAEEGGGAEGFWKGLLAHRSRWELDEIEGLRNAMWADVGNLEYPDGFPSGKDVKCQWQDTALHSRIDHAFQALALDENRAAFDPSLWRLNPREPSETHCAPNLKQCWFPGFHETVGGGATDTADAKDRTDIADITLAWMCDQVDGLLDFDDDAVAEFLGAEQSTTHQKQSERQSVRRRSHPTVRPGMPTSTAGGGLMYTLLTAVLNRLLVAISFLQREGDGAEGGHTERYSIRTPGQYHKNLEFAEGVHPDDFATNESIHPSVKHRKDLFALASTPYDAASLREWAVGDAVDEIEGKNHNGADGKREADTAAMPGWFPWLSVFSSPEDDEYEGDNGEVGTAGEEEEEAEGRSANMINTAAETVRAAAGPRRKPHPRWGYREIEGEGDGAEWIRPSVPRSELFGSPRRSSSTPCPSSTFPSPSEKALKHGVPTLVPAYLRRSRGPLSSSLRLVFFAVFWPWFFLYHTFSFFFLPLFLVHPKARGKLHRNHRGEEKRKMSATNNRTALQWHHERQIALPEWVIREVPGRRNFEAQLLPWLVREQLNHRNAKRLDWRGEDVCWARSTFGTVIEEEVEGAEAGAGPEAGPEVVKRGDGARSGGGGDVEVAPDKVTPVVKRKGPLHVRKGSTAEVLVTGNSGAGSGERRQSQTAVGGGWRSGGGLKVLAQQPERRSSIKRDRESPIGFSPGHKKTQSQTSVSWR
ncbi:peptidoglycan binding domain containing protein [Diplodia corticola]|uniref:Peptidoglycan binding domain containing protein n=1 Tax=Diplodia corticola TaxID=236234 RepID=A0A1J9QL02_9PEZI|nr:peptidoglycan binding domain containing protein [Diplodia corticola]OJD29566.1 peptidoglycan binding domain containing protein [Diplodia corticola]